MIINFYYNANIIKLLAVFFCIIIYSQQSNAQEDPISEELKNEKQDYMGANLKKNEAEELEGINTKYALTEKEIELRSKQRSGEKLSLIDKFRIGRSNRKDYKRNKRFEEFKKNKVLNSQSEKTRKRMLANKKKSDTKYKREKQRKKRKAFFSIFK